MSLREKSKQPPKSLLQTASNVKLGASKKALNVIRSNVHAPVKKVNLVPKSDESKISVLTGSIALEEGEAMKPPMVLEVGEYEGPEKKKEVKSKPTFAGPKFRSGKIKFGLETARRITPQPLVPNQRLMKVSNGKRIVMESGAAQKGIIISAPSPMSLDRVHVQLGQEKVLPESKEALARKEQEQRERERLAREREYQKTIDDVKKQLQSIGIKEQGEGFEVIDAESQVLRTMMQKVQTARDNPRHMAEARFLARKALASGRSNGKGLASQLQNFSVPNKGGGFPVSEILMDEESEPKTTNESISTIGNPPIKTNALIDRLESETATALEMESATDLESAGNEPRVVIRGQLKQRNGDMEAFIYQQDNDGDCAMGEMFVDALIGREDVVDFANTDADEEADYNEETPVKEPNTPRVANILLDDDDVVDLTKTNNNDRLRTRSTTPKSKDRRESVDRYAVAEDLNTSNGVNPTSPRSMGGIPKGEEEGADSHNKGEIPNCAYFNADCTGFDPSAGVMCGAVPLYFMYKSQKEEEDEINRGRMTAVLKSNDNLRELQQKVAEAADIAMKDSRVGETEVKKSNKQILDKDDAYWDTLSTIASTRGGLDAEKFGLPTTKASPGPIPIEITTNKDGSAEMIEITTNTDDSEDKKETQEVAKRNQTKVIPENPAFMVQSKTPEVAGTDIQKDEIDPPTPKASSKPLDPDPVLLSNENMNTMNASGNNKVISWGPEKSYKVKAARSPKRFTYDGEPLIEDDEPPLDDAEEQDLLTKTLQLSKDLLKSLGQEMKAQPQQQPQQIVDRNNLHVDTDVDTYNGKQSYSSNESFPIDVEKLIAEHGIRQAYEDEEVISIPDEYYLQEHNANHRNVYHQDSYQQGPGAHYHNGHEQEMINTPEMDEFRSPRTPQILSKLDILRSQRAQALARFQDSRRQADGLPPSSTPDFQDNQYDKSTSMGGPESQQQGPVKFFQHSPINGQYQVMLIEENEGASEEASITPSKKAQVLRRQLDQALLASREIRKSQEKLGDDLQIFKSRLYQRNGELEDQALRAMRTTARGIRHADI